MEAERLKAHWYSKRINQNSKINQFLISKIMEHKTLEFPWTKEQLHHLAAEDLLELAIATVNPEISIVLGKGQDYSNGKDAKFRIARRNSSGYSAGIKTANKTHILALVFEPIQEKFYFFSFPVSSKEFEIPFDPITGEPKRWTRNGENAAWTWEIKSFEAMSLS
jgi:hypothetical protein